MEDPRTPFIIVKGLIMEDPRTPLIIAFVVFVITGHMGLIGGLLLERRIIENNENYHSKICSLVEDGSVPIILNKKEPTRDGPWSCISGSTIFTVE